MSDEDEASPGLHASDQPHFSRHPPDADFVKAEIATFDGFWQCQTLDTGHSCSQPVTLARRAPKMPNLLSFRRVSPVGFARTHDNQRLHAGAGSGGGRSSAISCRMSANKCREI